MIKRFQFDSNLVFSDCHIIPSFVVPYCRHSGEYTLTASRPGERLSGFIQFST
jgi:hypothetical protein